jgi:hypothetical protein
MWTKPSPPTTQGCRRKWAPLGLTVSNPPIQAEMQAIADKHDEVITALHGG